MDGSPVDVRFVPCGLPVQTVNDLLDNTLRRMRKLNPKGKYNEYFIFHQAFGGGEGDKEVAYAAAATCLWSVNSTPQEVIDWCHEYLRLNPEPETKQESEAA